MSVKLSLKSEKKKISQQEFQFFLRYSQQTPRVFLSGDSIHIHLYRIHLCHLVSGSEIHVFTFVSDIRAGLNAR